MNIKAFIDKVGVQHLANLLGVSPRAVYAWRDGSRTPRPELVARIVNETPVTYAGIYNAEPAQRVGGSHGSQEVERPRNTIAG